MFFREVFGAETHMAHLRGFLAPDSGAQSLAQPDDSFRFYILWSALLGMVVKGARALITNDKFLQHPFDRLSFGLFIVVRKCCRENLKRPSRINQITAILPSAGGSNTDCICEMKSPEIPLKPCYPAGSVVLQYCDNFAFFDRRNC
ncbi:hypothetical protein Zmor_009323 [Zophobas morio]|uniref:Uncharacterized protein n=1 Tax=Zophobas morio TaxID=2755281 RepID=A0AA38IIL1_9CUCU|nr:hypothetical protein Zmor_009323 [Zophobas morio]